MKSRLKILWARHKLLIVLTLIALAGVLSFFSVKIFLYLNFLVGNDIIVKLEANKEDLFLTRGESEVVKFETSVTTNPFCTAKCEYSFTDISQGAQLDKNVSTLRPGSSLEREYEITAEKFGKGQDLYRFDIECSSVNTWLCHTDEDVTTRSILVTVNYDLNEEDKRLKDDLKTRLKSLTQRISVVIGKKNGLDDAIENLNKSLTVEDLENLSNSIDLIVKKSTDDLLLFEKIFGQSKYYLISKGVISLEQDTDAAESMMEELENNVKSTLSSYESIVSEISYTRDALEEIRNSLPEDYTFILEVNKTIEDFNQGLAILNGKNSLDEKERVMTLISEEVDQIVLHKQNLTNLSESNITLDGLDRPYLEMVSLSEEFFPADLSISFEDPVSQCCVFKKCRPCCTTEECRNDPSTFPVMFLHGHAVSEGVSAEYSLEGFNKIQKRLEKDGYLNVGAITLYTPQAVSEGLWGLSGVPVTVRSSYYFDIFQEPENYVVVQTKSESIDTYAIRLKELIDAVKYRTGKPKVNIIAFSMGGLVARRYLQVFGSEDVSIVILIGSPNKGVTGDVARVCPLVGAKLECRDLTEGSLFLNKLNRGPNPSIPAYVIAGTGCLVDDGTGDGIVLESHATLPGLENHVIKGTCKSKFKPLHLDLLKPELYPEVYDLILEKLKKS